MSSFLLILAVLVLSAKRGQFRALSAQPCRFSSMYLDGLSADESGKRRKDCLSEGVEYGQFLSPLFTKAVFRSTRTVRLGGIFYLPLRTLLSSYNRKTLFEP